MSSSVSNYTQQSAASDLTAAGQPDSTEMQDLILAYLIQKEGADANADSDADSGEDGESDASGYQLSQNGGAILNKTTMPASHGTSAASTPATAFMDKTTKPATLGAVAATGAAAASTSTNAAPSPDQATSNWQSSDPGEQATTAWQSSDSTGYAQYQADLKKGDGNAMVQDIHKALASGALTSDQATALYQQAQTNASAYGGGAIGKSQKSLMATDQTASNASAWAQSDAKGAAKYQADAAKGDGNAMVQDIHDALAKGSITASQAAAMYAQAQTTASANGGGKISGAMHKLMAADTMNANAPSWASADPTSYAQFQADAAKGDGNAMVKDIQSAQQSGAITAAQAQQMFGQAQTIASAGGGGKLSKASDQIIANSQPGTSSYAAYAKYLADGNGNAMVDQINKGMSNGSLSMDDATSLFGNAEQAAAANGGGNLGNSQRQMVGSVVGASALTAWNTADSAGYQKYQADMKKGDGNAMVTDIHNALVSGAIDKAQAEILYMQVPTEANNNGGGAVSAASKATAKADTGDNKILNGGETHAMHEFKKVMKDIGIGLAVVVGGALTGGALAAVGAAAGIGAGVAAGVAEGAADIGVAAGEAGAEAGVEAGTEVGVEAGAESAEEVGAGAAEDVGAQGAESAVAENTESAAQTSINKSLGTDMMSQETDSAASAAASDAEETSGNWVSRALNSGKDTANKAVSATKDAIDDPMGTLKNLGEKGVTKAKDKVASVQDMAQRAIDNPEQFAKDEIAKLQQKLADAKANPTEAAKNLGIWAAEMAAWKMVEHEGENMLGIGKDEESASS